MSRVLVEDELFIRQLESLTRSLASEEVLEEALNAVTWTLSRKPEALPVIPGTNSLRLIRTHEYERSGITVPPLKVWFRILDDTRVLLLAVTKEGDTELTGPDSL